MRIGAALAVVGSLLLSGCFEMDQAFTFQPDGSAEMVLEMSVDASLIAMTEQAGKEPFCGDGMLQGMEKDGLAGTIQRSTAKGDVVCLMRISGQADALVAALAGSEVMPGQKSRMGVSLTKDDDDQYVLTVSLPPARSAEDKNPMGEGMENMFLASMAGRSLDWTVAAPSIVETTGKMSEDGKSATFSVPLVEVFTNKSRTYEFRTAFRLSEPGFLGWLKGLSR